MSEMEKAVENCKILAHKKISQEYTLMKVHSPRVSRSAKPGMFVHVLAGDGEGLLLRRPFSLLEAEHANISFVYKVVGHGTKALSEKRPGEVLNVLGPLGNPYSVRAASKQIILVAGGYGVSPTFYLSRELKKKRFTGEIISIIGARTKSLLMYAEEFKKLGVKTHVTTDDGSAGRKGIVTDALGELLQRSPLPPRPLAPSTPFTQVFCCGPYAMLRAVARMCMKFSVPCQVSMEQQLGCGLGACLGCVIKTHGGYRRVCTEGPVFNAEDVIWE